MTHVKNELCVALLGKTGNGKSSTANTILQKEERDFLAENKLTSVTRNARYGKTKIGDETLCVFDTPGETFTAGNHKEDIGKPDAVKKFNDLKRTLTFIEAVLRDNEIAGDVCAFVLVFSYVHSRFTGEEQTTVSTYKKLLGQDVFSSHGIIAFSYGDSFEEQQGHSNVKYWCEEQVGPFKELYAECKQRVVLMYNTTKENFKDQRQKGVDEILRHARQIKSERDSYTWEKYQLASESRKDIYLEYQSHTLIPGFEKDLENLRCKLSKLQGNVTENGRKELLKEIGFLEGRIEDKREGRPLFKDLLNNLKSLEQCVPVVPQPKQQGPACTIV